MHGQGKGMVSDPPVQTAHLSMVPRQRMFWWSLCAVTDEGKEGGADDDDAMVSSGSEA